jgi:hypothetical protein
VSNYNDLIQRLREMAQCDVGECLVHAEIEREAADALERLTRERDAVLAKTHDGTLWQPAYMLLMAERDHLRAAADALEHISSVLVDKDREIERMTKAEFCRSCGASIPTATARVDAKWNPAPEITRVEVAEFPLTVYCECCAEADARGLQVMHKNGADLHCPRCQKLLIKELRQ